MIINDSYPFLPVGRSSEFCEYVSICLVKKMAGDGNRRNDVFYMGMEISVVMFIQRILRMSITFFGLISFKALLSSINSTSTASVFYQWLLLSKLINATFK